MSKKPPMPKIDLAGVGRRLEALRLTTGLTRDAFSATIGYDASSYTKTAGGKKPFLPEYAYATAETWSVTMDYIYRGTLDHIDGILRAKLIANLKSLEE